MNEESPSRSIGGGIVLGIITFAILHFAIGMSLGPAIVVGCLWVVAFAASDHDADD